MSDMHEVRPTDVPDDVIRCIEVGDVRLGIYRDGIVAVTVRFLGSIPLKPGERVEVEVVEVERSVVER